MAADAGLGLECNHAVGGVIDSRDVCVVRRAQPLDVTVRQATSRLTTRFPTAMSVRWMSQVGLGRVEFE